MKLAYRYTRADTETFHPIVIPSYSQPRMVVLTPSMCTCLCVCTFAIASKIQKWDYTFILFHNFFVSLDATSWDIFISVHVSSQGRKPVPLDRDCSGQDLLILQSCAWGHSLIVSCLGLQNNITGLRYYSMTYRIWGWQQPGHLEGNPGATEELRHKIDI